MANIKINELSALNLSGAELFNDSESFMMELNEESEQMGNILGGCLFGTNCGAVTANCDISCLQTCLINTVVNA